VYLAVVISEPSTSTLHYISLFSLLPVCIAFLCYKVCCSVHDIKFETEIFAIEFVPIIITSSPTEFCQGVFLLNFDGVYLFPNVLSLLLPNMLEHKIYAAD
jgi:hypothetical protein